VRLVRSVRSVRLAGGFRSWHGVVPPGGAGGCSAIVGRPVGSHPVIDLKLVREDPDAVRSSQRTRGEDPSLVDTLLAADTARRAAVLAADTLRAEQRTVSGQVGKLMGAWQKAQKSGAPDAAELKATADAARAQAGELSERVKAAEVEQAAADCALDTAHRAISNVVQLGAPAGGEDDYVVLSHHGQVPEIPAPKDHLELAEGLALLDVERGAKVSGARFYFLTGVGALLQLGLLQLAAQKAVANGFTLTIPPVLVRPEIMAGTGFLGAHAAEVYKLADDDLYLVGTSEVPMAGFHADEILDLSGGPKRYAGWSTCFRREAGSYGKDTRGIMRVHQFDKVEMFSWCRPEDADAEHQRLLGWEQEMLAAVDVPYRIIDTAGGDLGSSAARKYDCEAWVPSQQAYRELTSTSNCTTFQARRLNVRYRDEAGRTQVAATLNGTLATTRWIVAILENHQEPDGSVRVPRALQPFVGTDVLRP
jgi:seryl-tRNA synthetase